MLYIYLIIGGLFIVNVAISIYVSKSDDLESSQKKMQIVLVWVIPFLGAFFCWKMNRIHDDITEPNKTFGGGDNNTGYDAAGTGGSDGGGSD